MPEPTIEHLLKWLDEVVHVWGGTAETNAIRVILTERKLRTIPTADLLLIQLEAIRAFVGRVEKRYFAPHDGPQQGYRFYMQKELAALEGEAALMSEAENNYWIHQCQCTSCEEYRAKNQSKWDAAVIEAFVERVGVRYASDKPWAAVDIYLRFMREELSAMEKGNDTE